MFTTASAVLLCSVQVLSLLHSHFSSWPTAWDQGGVRSGPVSWACGHGSCPGGLWAWLNALWSLCKILSNFIFDFMFGKWSLVGQEGWEPHRLSHPTQSLGWVLSYLLPWPWCSYEPPSLPLHVTSQRPMWPAAPGSGWGAGMGRVRVRHACTAKCQGGALQWLSLPQAGSITTHSATRQRWALYVPWARYQVCPGMEVSCIPWVWWGLMGNRNAWLYLPALSPQLGHCSHLAVGRWSNLATCGPPGAPWATLRVYTCLTSISELKCMWH